MTLQGIVVNGVIVLDGAPALPEGARVWVELEAEDELDDIAPPPPTETYEQHLASLRQSIADAKAGVGGMTLEKFAAELDKEFGPLPAKQG
jgi:hypothetical protein